MRRIVTNTELIETVRFLKMKAKENKSRLWNAAAEYLSRPRRAKVEVNLSGIARVTRANSCVLVPGKVLAAGSINHSVVVGAFAFSKNAKAKIERAGGKCVPIRELVSLYPKGSRVQILR